MSPFAGMGANVAMYDGLELGLVLAEAVSEVAEREAAGEAVEEKLAAKAEVFAQMSSDNVALAFAEGSPQPMSAAFRKLMGLE